MPTASTMASAGRNKVRHRYQRSQDGFCVKKNISWYMLLAVVH